ncbi:MAG: hypothetical protein E6J81_04550 [Deltaproteobacteria bacterium]|nr:MAG: hypothetical protein E6J81_04550 [Deltaproteobacteria bacterium]
MLGLAGADVASAESHAPLVLPLGNVAAVTAVPDPEPPASHPTVNAIRIPPPRTSGGPLPAQLHIPDGYAVGIDRKTPWFAAPVDSDHIVSMDLFRHPRHGWMMSFAYDQEARRPLPGGADVVGVVFEYGF